MKVQSPQGLSEEEFHLLKRIMVFGISQCVTFSLLCYFNRSFHFIHLSCIMFWNASGSLISSKDSSQLMPILGLVKCFKYGSCMIFCSIIQLSIFLLYQLLWEGAFKMLLSCMDSQIGKPMHGSIVYLGISSLLTNILSLFLSLHTPSDNLCL